MNEETKFKIAEAITKLLPNEIVVEIVKGSIEHCISSLTWGNNAIEGLIKKAIEERTMELLRTQYKDEVNKQAQFLAAKVVSEMINRQSR